MKGCGCQTNCNSIVHKLGHASDGRGKTLDNHHIRISFSHSPVTSRLYRRQLSLHHGPFSVWPQVWDVLTLRDLERWNCSVAEGGWLLLSWMGLMNLLGPWAVARDWNQRGQGSHNVTQETRGLQKQVMHWKQVEISYIASFTRDCDFRVGKWQGQSSYGGSCTNWGEDEGALTAVFLVRASLGLAPWGGARVTKERRETRERGIGFLHQSSFLVRYYDATGIESTKVEWEERRERKAKIGRKTGEGKKGTETRGRLQSLVLETREGESETSETDKGTQGEEFGAKDDSHSKQLGGK